MHKRITSSNGFTIVELLIVVVVIAILAAISIVAYTNIQNRAYDSTVKHDLSSAAKKLSLFNAEFERYPASLSQFPSGFEFSKSVYATNLHNVLYCLNLATNEYAIGATSKSGAKYILTERGLQEDVISAGPAEACIEVGTNWSSPPPSAPRAAVHGFNPGKETNGGWNDGWSWVN